MVMFLVIPGSAVLHARLHQRPPGASTSPEFVGFTTSCGALRRRPDVLGRPAQHRGVRVVVVPVQGGLALLLAVLINQKLRAITAFRVLFFMPVVTSMVVVAMLWKFMYQTRRPDQLALFGFERRLAQQPVDRAACGDRHVDLAGGRIPHDHLAAGPADHLARALRGGVAGRRQSPGSSSGMSPCRGCGRRACSSSSRSRSRRSHLFIQIDVMTQRRTDQRDHDPRLPHHPDGSGRGDVGLRVRALADLLRASCWWSRSCSGALTRGGRLMTQLRSPNGGHRGRRQARRKTRQRVKLRRRVPGSLLSYLPAGRPGAQLRAPAAVHGRLELQAARRRSSAT